MKNLALVIFLCIGFMISGCIASGTETQTFTSSTQVITEQTAPTQTLTKTTPAPTLSPTLLIKIEATPTVSPTAPQTFPPEAKLRLKCLEVLPFLPDWTEVNGIILLDSRSQNITGTLLVNMKTGETTQLAVTEGHLHSFVVSPDRKSMAFANVIFDKEGRIVREDLILADADGVRQKVILWEENWHTLLGITNDQRALISYDTSGISAEKQYPRALLVLNPFTGQRQTVNPNFPGYIRQATIPFWDGWNGVLYDPTASYAIYPKSIPDELGEDFAFALWDVKKNRLVSTFEDIYSNLKMMSMAAPMPVWSPDGSQFGLPGQFIEGKELRFELFKVSKDGLVEQLTHLSNIAAPRGLIFSWSPNSSKIAMYLYSYSYMTDDHAALLDLNSGDVTDFCVEKHGNHSKAPIWSPDGTQILVYDQYTEKQSRVILIDIVQNFAAVIAEDMEPVGWMTNDK